MVYANVNMTEDYSQDSKYADSLTSTGAGSTPWDNKRLAVTAAYISTIVPPYARVLDVGCANGGLLAALKDLGFTNLTGIDPSPACVAETVKKGIYCHRGGLPDLSINLEELLGEFDLIILSHVLEHLLNPGQAIRALGRHHLSSRGLIYIEVPDAEHYKDMVISPYQDINTEHINHFSDLGLRNLLSQSGYECLADGWKLIPASAQHATPALYHVFREDHLFTYRLKRDEDLKPAIVEYLNKSHRLLHNIDLHLCSNLAPDKPVILWGAGQLLHKLLSSTLLHSLRSGTVLHSLRIAAIVDSNPASGAMNLQQLRQLVYPNSSRDADWSSYPIVICSILHDQSILASIKELGLPNPVIHLLPQKENQ
jgi:SAM-dependent methyltransferase